MKKALLICLVAIALIGLVACKQDPKTCRISFDANGGTGDKMADLTAEYDKEVTLTKTHTHARAIPLPAGTIMKRPFTQNTAMKVRLCPKKTQRSTPYGKRICPAQPGWRKLKDII